MYSHKIVVRKASPAIVLVQNNNTLGGRQPTQKFANDNELLEELPKLPFQPGDYVIYGSANCLFTKENPCHVTHILEHQTDAKALTYDHLGHGKYYLCVGVSHIPNASGVYVRYDDLTGYRKVVDDELKAILENVVVQDNLQKSKQLVIDSRN